MQTPLEIFQGKDLNIDKINQITSSIQFVCNALEQVKKSKYSANKLTINKTELKLTMVCSAIIDSSKILHQTGNLSLVPDQILEKAKYELVVEFDDAQKEALSMIYQACFNSMKPGEVPTIKLSESNQIKLVYPVMIGNQFSDFPLYEIVSKEPVLVVPEDVIKTLTGTILSLTFTAVPWSINGKSGVSFKISKITKLGLGSFGSQRGKRHSAEEFTPMIQSAAKKSKV